ncbi:hypothetical protein [Rhodophyticola porphyridii]|uniref:hypothetical protein n=1 Tax=Rhodophyticola porphyridii TaxID=1852017 RepID=UPI0011C41CAD|nr:hypothetical protein [Rhodophyticola porphyridii]
MAATPLEIRCGHTVHNQKKLLSHDSLLIIAGWQRLISAVNFLLAPLFLQADHARKKKRGKDVNHTLKKKGKEI